MAYDPELCPLIRTGVKLEKLPLSPQEGFVLSRVNGVTKVRDIVAATGLPEAMVQAALEKLESLQAIEWQKIEVATPRPRSAARPTSNTESSAAADTEFVLRRVELIYKTLEKQDFYKLLGVSRMANPDQIKEAYAGLSRELHPDRFFKVNLGSRKPMLDTVFARISEAYDVLRDPDRRIAYDRSMLPQGPGMVKPEPKAKLTADPSRIEQLGDQDFRIGNYASALRSYKLAVSMAPGDRGIADKMTLTEDVQSLVNNLEKVVPDPAAARALGDKVIPPLLAKIRSRAPVLPDDEHLLSLCVQFSVEHANDLTVAKELGERLYKLHRRAPYAFYLGQIAEAMKNRSEALSYYERAVSIDANYLPAKEAVRRIKK